MTLNNQVIFYAMVVQQARPLVLELKKGP